MNDETEEPQTANTDAIPKQQDEQAATAEAATEKAADAGTLPANAAIANPKKAKKVDGASGAVIEEAITNAVPLDHPAVNSAGTSEIQNGADYNDPRHLHPSDPDFVGEGLDLSVYGEREPVTAPVHDDGSK